MDKWRAIAGLYPVCQMSGVIEKPVKKTNPIPLSWPLKHWPVSYPLECPGASWLALGLVVSTLARG
jgi:hypothetical protein